LLWATTTRAGISAFTVAHLLVGYLCCRAVTSIVADAEGKVA
jgi:hypothetical protein